MDLVNKASPVLCHHLHSAVRVAAQMSHPPENLLQPAQSSSGLPKLPSCASAQQGWLFLSPDPETPIPGRAGLPPCFFLNLQCQRTTGLGMPPVE